MTTLPRALAATAAALTLILAGCSSSPESDSPGQEDSDANAPDSDDAADIQIGDGSGVPMPDATGEFGDTPTFTWPENQPDPNLQVQVIEQGEGELVEEESTVVANYLGIIWGENSPFDSSYERGEPSVFPLNGVVEGWRLGIPNHEIGSRLLITIPPELGYGADGNPGAGIGGEDTIVFIVDVVNAVGLESLGEEDAEAIDLPEDVGVTIDGELGQRATAVVDQGLAEPEEPQVFQISQGSGDAVSAGQNSLVSYAITTWDNSETMATWMEELGSEAGPQEVLVSSGSTWGLLEGIEVGSRVLIIQDTTEQSPPLAIVADLLVAY